MIFQFTASQQFDFIKEFAEKFQLPVQENLLVIPKKYGEGYIRKITLDQDFRLLIHQYTLKEDLLIQRNATTKPNDLLSIFFYNNESPIELQYGGKKVPFSNHSDTAIQITTNDLSSTIQFPANTHIQYLVIGITARVLRPLLSPLPDNTTLQTITTSQNSFLFFERMQAESKSILQKITAMNMQENLSQFYIKIKVQELLYLLFHRLSIRENHQYKKINNADAEALFMISSEILSDLSQPPVLQQLANKASMSETKLKQLFKQSFGDTIYTYYQKARMDKAAFLLREGGRSVSQAGYELGFANLSHFSRLFFRHYGTTPKKFASVG